MEKQLSPLEDSLCRDYPYLLPDMLDIYDPAKPRIVINP